MEINAGEEFLAQYVTEDVETHEVKLPSGKGTMKVRALTRLEAMKMREKGEMVSIEMEQKMCALGIVDPKMTEKQVARWQEISPAGDMETVIRKIMDLSGLEERPGKSSLSEVRE